jgi:hypothetical protein
MRLPGTVLHLHRVSMWRELAVALRFQALSAFFAFEIATYQLPAHFALGLTANRGFTSTDRQYTSQQIGGRIIDHDAGRPLSCGASSAAFQSWFASTNLQGSVGTGEIRDCQAHQCLQD